MALSHSGSEKVLERDCTFKCRSKSQALHLISAVIRGNYSEIRSYCKFLCGNFASLSDKYGRTLLHISSSCGKAEVVSWLLENCHSDLDAKDKESGWTSLHRSLFYGQITVARILLRHRANLKIFDHEGLTPLDIITKDKIPNVEYRSSDPSEVYIWGSNINFNLGFGNDLNRDHPELLEIFRKGFFSVSKVILCKFHSVFLTNNGQLFSCGHGHGGRLGQCSEATVLNPSPVKGLEQARVIEVASGQHHMVILTEGGQIWTCGLNSYHQLGHLPPPERLLSPRPISMKLLKGYEIVGCKAAKYHSVIYTKEAIFTFGLNAGQLGHNKGESTQILPRQVSSLNNKDTQIILVEASDGATVCATNKGDVYVLHEYQCRKMASRQLELKKICVVGGHLDSRCDVSGIKESGGQELKVLLLTQSGKLYLWREVTPTLRRCIFTQVQEIVISDVCLNCFGLGIVTLEGTGFSGHFVQAKESGTIKKSGDTQLNKPTGSMNLVSLLNREDCEAIRLKRIPYLHRATSITCEPKGRNFAVIQSHPKTCLYELPILSCSMMENDFKKLFQEASLEDSNHDVVFKVGKVKYPAHRYILSSRCDYFHKQLNKIEQNNDGSKVELIIDNCEASDFIVVLEFIYSNSGFYLKEGNELPEDMTKLSNLLVIPESGDSKKKKKKSNSSIPPANPHQIKLNNLTTLAKRYGLKTLAERFHHTKIENNYIRNQHSIFFPKIEFNQNNFQEYYDVCLKSQDGVEFPCHRCILIARMNYFESMLGFGWMETKKAEPILMPMPSKILSIIIDYLYKDSSLILYESEDPEFLCQVLVVADQYLIPRLKEICELAIVDLITLKNVCELLELAHIYNAVQLKNTCLQYVCFNLAILLEMECLEVLSDEIMEEVTRLYRATVPGMGKRRITPYRYGPSSEELSEIDILFPVEPDEDMRPNEVIKNRSGKRRPRKISERQIDAPEELNIPEKTKEIIHDISKAEGIVCPPKNIPVSVKAEIKKSFSLIGKWNIEEQKTTNLPSLSDIMQAERKAQDSSPKKIEGTLTILPKGRNSSELSSPIQIPPR